MKLMGRDSIAIVPTALVRCAITTWNTPTGLTATFYLGGFAEPDAVAVLVPNCPQGHTLRATAIRRARPGMVGAPGPSARR